MFVLLQELCEESAEFISFELLLKEENILKDPTLTSKLS